MTVSHQKILVIKLSALGDFIQALGPMAAIRRHHSEAHITALTTAPYRELAQKCGYFDEIWIDKRPRWHQPLGLLKLALKFNKARFSRIYDLQNNNRTSLYFKMLRGIKPQWVGTAKGASHCNDSPQRTAGLAFNGHVQTLGLAGVDNVEIDDLHWVEGDIKKFGLTKPYVLLVPGSAPQHPYKRWPAAHYGVLAKALVEKGMQPVILGTAAESKEAAEITKICPVAKNLVAQTALLDLPVLARHAVAAVGNDTGPLHLIAPTGCPALVLFSQHSNPVRHAPLGASVQTMQRDDLKDLSVEVVLEALESLI